MRPWSSRVTEPVTLYQSQPGALGPDGRYQAPDRVAVAIRAVVAPATSGYVRELVPEGSKIEDAREFWIAGQAVTSTALDKAGDWIGHRGVVYRVISTRDWGRGFIAAVGAYIDPQPSI